MKPHLLPVFFLVACTIARPQATGNRSTSPSAADLDTFRSATEALRADHIEEAIMGFSHVTVDAPRFAEGYFNLGLALSHTPRNEETATALERAVALKPSMRGAHLFLAISLYKLTRIEPAAAAIRRETALYPGDAQAWMWQGIIDLARGNLATAVEDLDHAYSLDNKNVDILYHRGRAALALSRDSYETMFHLDPQSWHIHQVLAEADVESDHDTDAVEQYKQAIAAAPPQSGLYEALGSALWRTGKFEEAAGAYETALTVDPGDILTMYKLGCLKVDRGDAIGGKPLLDKVILLDPSLKLASYYLGRAQSALGDDRAAVDNFKKVIAENVDADTTKQAYFQLSRSFRRLHDTAAATEAQTQYRILDQAGRDAMQQKLSQRTTRADRDASIPAPSTETPSETQP